MEKVKRTSCGIIHAVDDPRVGISLALITEPKFVTQDFDFTTLHFSQDLEIASESQFQKNLENAESRYHRFGDQNIRTRRHKSTRWCCRRFRRLRMLHNFLFTTFNHKLVKVSTIVKLSVGDLSLSHRMSCFQNYPIRRESVDKNVFADRTSLKRSYGRSTIGTL